MRLLLSWARDFVDVTAPADEVAEKLALRGFEVAGVEPLGAGDAVIDFEVTANRPDCLSVFGLAREIAAAYNLTLGAGTGPAGSPFGSSPATGQPDDLDVVLEDPDSCPRYAAAVAAIVPAVSPSWMTARLQASGIRPISPIVDVTNYVLMELGHPMHAFDLSRLAGSTLRIRRASAGETLTTLDGVERALDPDMLVIADATKAQAVAGVMGGAASEVSGETRTIAFESAYFKPTSVRRTSKRLSLKTEASARFERGADVNAPVVALARAIDLMERVGAGRARGPIVDRYPRPVSSRRLHLRRARLALVLGSRVPDAEVERILRALGLGVTPAADGWEVETPTFRVDLLREIDLIEEVGRHYGFDRLEATFPSLSAPPPPSDPRIARDGLLRRALTARGFSEAVTFGFVEARAADAFVSAADATVKLANPLSAKFDVLRPSLIPGLVDAVAYNRRHGLRDVALFEIGARFRAASGERRSVALAWTGSAQPEHWSSGVRDLDFFDVTGAVEDLCGALGVPVRFVPSSPSYLVPGQSADAVVGDAVAGVLGLVQPSISEDRGAPRHDRIFVAELDLDRLFSQRPAVDEGVRPLPRFPFVVRDISIVVPDILSAEVIRGTIHTAARGLGAPLVAVFFFDRYKGKELPAEAISVSVRLTFQAPDRTLTDAEVQQGVEAIVAALAREHGARQR